MSTHPVLLVAAVIAILGGPVRAESVSSGPPPPPKRVTRDDLHRALARVHACGTASAASGVVKVGIHVAANGSPTAVTIWETPDRALGDCVARALIVASFPATPRGTTIFHRFHFRARPAAR